MDMRQVSTLLTLKELGMPMRMDTFENRLIVQKTIFLVQEAGLDLGHFFRWYLRGPYAPSISKDLFPAIDELSGDPNALVLWRLSPQSVDKLSVIKGLFDSPHGVDDQARWLELVASVLFLLKREMIDPVSTQVGDRLRQLGKDFDDVGVGEAIAALRDHDYVTSA